jgi:hypothetical protein
VLSLPPSVSAVKPTPCPEASPPPQTLPHVVDAGVVIISRHHCRRLVNSSPCNLQVVAAVLSPPTPCIFPLPLQALRRFHAGDPTLLAGAIKSLTASLSGLWQNRRMRERMKLKKNTKEIVLKSQKG